MLFFKKSWWWALPLLPWGNPWDIQWNFNSTAFAWFPVWYGASTDGTYVWMGNTQYVWLIDYTQFWPDWFQNMNWLARPKKRMYFDLSPTCSNPQFDFPTPYYAEWFDWIEKLPYWYWPKDTAEYQRLPFSFMIPEDYQGWSRLYWKLHFSVVPDSMTLHDPWTAVFGIEYTRATSQNDCREWHIWIFTPKRNTIMSCRDIEVLQTEWPSYSTKQTDETDWLIIYGEARAWDIIKGRICRRYDAEEDTFEGQVVPLYLTIQYVSDKMGTSNDGRSYP